MYVTESKAGARPDSQHTQAFLPKGEGQAANHRGPAPRLWVSGAVPTAVVPEVAKCKPTGVAVFPPNFPEGH